MALKLNIKGTDASLDLKGLLSPTATTKVDTQSSSNVDNDVNSCFLAPSNVVGRLEVRLFNSSETEVVSIASDKPEAARLFLTAGASGAYTGSTGSSSDLRWKVNTADFATGKLEIKLIGATDTTMVVCRTRDDGPPVNFPASYSTTILGNGVFTLTIPIEVVDV